MDEVADQRLAPDLFSQVSVDVGVEFLLRVLGVVHLRQPAVKEVAAEVELRDLRGGQWEQVRLPRPPAEQVHAAALELAAARPAQHEVHFLRLYQVVHLVEQDRQLLDLVDHDHRRIRRSVGAALGHDLAHPGRILGKRQVLAAAQKVDDSARTELHAPRPYAACWRGGPPPPRSRTPAGTRSGRSSAPPARRRRSPSSARRAGGSRRRRRTPRAKYTAPVPPVPGVS